MSRIRPPCPRPARLRRHGRPARGLRQRPGRARPLTSDAARPRSPPCRSPSPSAPTTAPPTPTGKPKPRRAQPGAVPCGRATPAPPRCGGRSRLQAIGGDEFNSGSLDLKKWGLYDSVGGFGNGLRRPSAISQSGGSLVITASGDTSGGLADSFGQLYGRWEFRARTDHGRGFGSAILLWPDSEKLSDGEIDIAEVPFEKRDLAHFVLHSGSGGDTLNGSRLPGDFSQWHTFAVDWLPDHSPGTSTARAVHGHRQVPHPDTPMHLAIQLDEGPVKDWILPPDATTPPRSACRSTGFTFTPWAGAHDPPTTTPSKSAPRRRPRTCRPGARLTRLRGSAAEPSVAVR